MPRIHCRYIDCVFLEDGFCGANSVNLDPDEGCITYRRIGDVPEDEDWEEEELEEFWEEEDDSLYQDDEDDDEWVDESEN